MLITVMLCSTLLAGPAYFGDGNVTIELQSGMNLISIPVSLSEVAPEAVLGSLGNRLLGCYAYECDEFEGWWLSYSPQCPYFLNTLEGIRPGQAIVVIVDGPETLEVRGEPIDSIQIQINPGWNFVGYNGLAPQPPELVFGEVAGDVQIVWTYDLGEWLSYIPGVPPGPGFIELMEPGRGYWILALNTAEWFFDGVKYHGLRSRADLLVDDIWISPAQPLEDESVGVYARIKNDGYQPAFNVAVNFYERHPGSGYNSIGQVSGVNIAGRQQTNVSVNVPGGLLYQTIIKVIVDEGFPAGNIPELNEKNNRRTEEVHIRMPDPALETVSINPYFPYDDSTVTLTTDVNNLGDADANNFRLRFSVEDDQGTILWSSDVMFGTGGEQAIAPGASRSISRTVNLATYLSGPGYYRFRAEVDPNSALKEIDEYNNYRSRDLYVPDPPQLTLEEPMCCCWAHPNGPAVGDDVRVGITVRNVGGATATNIEMTYDDTNHSGGQWSQGNKTTIPSIPDGSYDSTLNWLQNVAQGTHNIKVTVTYTDESPPRSVQLTLPALEVRELRPDIWPYQLQCNQTYPIVNSNLQFTIEAKNIGEIVAGGFNVGLYYTQADPWTEQDLTPIGTAGVSGGLQTGQCASVTIQWNPSSAGEYTIVAWVDPSNALSEVWDNNNQFARKVIIRDHGPDLFARRFWPVPSNPMVNQETQLNCQVVNAGDAQATFSTTIYEQVGATRTEVGTVSGTALNPGQSTTVSVSWSPSEEGSYKFVAVADPSNAVTESLENNNEVSLTVNARPRPYSIVNTDDGVYADKIETQRDWDWDAAANKGKAWCMADSQDGCYWDTWYFIPYYNCDFEDRSSIRVAVYKTFRVDGPSGDSTPADVTLDTQILGIIDTLNADITGSAYWSIKEVVGIFEGQVSSWNLDSPMRSKVLLNEDTGTVLEVMLETGILLLLSEAAGIPPGVQEVLDVLMADVLVFGEGETTFDVALETGKEYTAFVYVDLVTAAVGLTSYSYADFYYHDPHNDMMAKELLKDRGVWLKSVTVDFK